MNHELQVFITRGMIAHALVTKMNMPEGEAWEFSGDLDMSIEQDYLPVADLNERYALILKDCCDYQEGEK